MYRRGEWRRRRRTGEENRRRFGRWWWRGEKKSFSVDRKSMKVCIYLCINFFFSRYSSRSTARPEEREKKNWSPSVVDYMCSSNPYAGWLYIEERKRAKGVGDSSAKLWMQLNSRVGNNKKWEKSKFQTMSLDGSQLLLMRKCRTYEIDIRQDKILLYGLTHSLALLIIVVSSYDRHREFHKVQQTLFFPFHVQRNNGWNILSVSNFSSDSAFAISHHYVMLQLDTSLWAFHSIIDLSANNSMSIIHNFHLLFRNLKSYYYERSLKELETMWAFFKQTNARKGVKRAGVGGADTFRIPLSVLNRALELGRKVELFASHRVHLCTVDNDGIFIILLNGTRLMLTKWENARENCSHTEDTVEMIWKEIRWKESRV